MVFEPRDHFLHIADADGAAGGRLEAVAAGEGEVNAIFEADPFFVGEEVAESVVAEDDPGRDVSCTLWLT